MKGLAPIPAAVRFAAGVDSSTGSAACWPWLRGQTDKGYGQLRVDGRVVKAHRYAVCLELNVTPMQLTEARAEVHHECENKLCCNPAHLFLIDTNSHARLHARDISRRVKNTSK